MEKRGTRMSKEFNSKNKKKANKGTLLRLIKMIFGFYPVLLPLILVCILVNAVVSSIPSLFQQQIISLIELN